MNTSIYIVLVALFSTLSFTAHLRTFEPNHELFGLDSMNPLQIAGLMSGDWASILPASIQPLARQILGQEQKSGVAGFLSQAQGLLGGNQNGGGLLGGMGNLFGQASQSNKSSGLGGLLNTFSGALGGGSQASSLFGLPNLSNLIPNKQGGLPNIQGLVPNMQGGLPNIQGLLPNMQGGLPNIQGLLPNMQGNNYEGATGNLLNNIGIRHHN